MKQKIKTQIEGLNWGDIILISEVCKVDCNTVFQVLSQANNIIGKKLKEVA